MPTNINSTQLDFDEIKSKLKTFFQQQPEFADYNFEGAGLSNLLDVLAYNTHVNGLTANFALNESFLTTAQLRSSVVSHAESLGYNPRSKTAAVAYLTLSITNTNSGRSSTVTMPRGTRFSTSVDGIDYTFQTLGDYSAADDGTGTYVFLNEKGQASIPVHEGTMVTKTFYVGDTDERQIYVIPDVSADTETMLVKVFNSSTSSSYTIYTPLKNAVRISSNSTFYSVHEAPNGFHEIHFGDGKATGRTPVSGNKIVVTYLRTAGASANKAVSFTPISTISMDGATYNLSVETDVAASGGSEKESIESIRQNAPIYFASQQRLVTAEDYRGQILANYGSVIDCIAWGGQDNDPPKYGSVYVSLKFDDDVDSDSRVAVKNSIVNDLSSTLAIMSIDTEFSDPITTYLSCETYFNYNPNLSSIPLNIAQSNVTNVIRSYFTDNLKRFGGTFRRSNLLALIDDLSPAILNSRMDVKIQQRFTPIVNQKLSYTIYFPVPIATSDESTTATVTSSTFYYAGKTCRISNKLTLAAGNASKLQIIDVDENVVVDNIGSLTANTGKVSLVGFEPTGIIGGSQIKIFTTPASQGTVKPLRNYILDLDLGTTFARGTLDYGQTRTSL